MKNVYLLTLILVMVGVTEYQAFTAETNGAIFNPQPITLKNAELKSVLDTWDNAVKSDLLKEKANAMLSVSKYVKVRGIGDHYVLAYTNPEIQERVVELYLMEWLRHPKPFKEADRVKEEKTNPWYGAGEGYMELLSALAESTFSDKIYQLELKPVELGVPPLRLLYLAKVKPEKTLDYILSATIGKKNEKVKYPSFMYSKDGAPHFIFELNEAFKVLALMCDLSPDVVRENRDKVLRFMREKSLYMSVPRISYDKKEPVYFAADDTMVRDAALDLIERIGEKEDMQLIDKIRQNASKEVVDKADQVKKQLEKKNSGKLTK